MGYSRRDIIFASIKRLKLIETEDCYVTCADRAGGIGSQVQSYFSTMLFASAVGIKYIHTPFKEVYHNPGQTDWEIRWEEFFGLGENETSINEIDQSNLEIIHLKQLTGFKKKANTLYIVPYCHAYTDLFPEEYLRFLARFRRKYYSVPKKSFEPCNEPSKVSIAIHIRRGDVSKTNKESFRYTENNYILSSLKLIIDCISSLNLLVSVNLYSEGEIDDFLEFKESEYNINYFLNNCTFTTFHQMVSADVLLMSKSSFAYSAALLSQGVVVYEPFWHSPLPGWVVIGQYKKISSRVLVERFRKLII